METNSESKVSSEKSRSSVIFNFRGTSKSAVRRFAVTENLEIPAWRDINHDQCGYHYKLTAEQDQHLRLNVPGLVQAYEHGTELIDQCLAKNEGFESAANRIVGGQASVPGYYPWLVALRLRDIHQCGASLINKCWIISGQVPKCEVRSR